MAIHCSRLLRPLWDWRQGDRASRYAAEVRATLRLGGEELQAYQLTRIRAICQLAIKFCDFYRERFASVGITDCTALTWDQFARIPKLTKEDILSHGPSMRNCEFKVGALRESATGGTTKAPMKIYMDWDAFYRRSAATREWDRRIGHSYGCRIAYLWGAQQDLIGGRSWKERLRQSCFTGQLFLPASPLDDRVMSEYVERLLQWKPSLLQAYPTPLAIFAEYLIRTGKQVRVDVIATTAEPLLPSQKRVIERAFGVVPYNWYGAREVGRIATECAEHEGMHVNAHGVFVEVEGEPMGACGPLLMTDLWNEGMPFIRYDIGDLGALDDNVCECGCRLPRLRAVEGRIADAFRSSSGQRISGVVFDVPFDRSEVLEMQLVQVGGGEFKAVVVPGAKWQPEMGYERIRRAVEELMREHVRIEVQCVPVIPREPSGKLRLCKNEWCD